MRTVPGIIHHVVPLEETLRNRFIPTTTGGQICNDTARKLLSLPNSFGRLAIPIFYEQVETEQRNSRKLTAQLMLINNHIKQYTVHETQIKIAKQVIKKRKARLRPHQPRSIKK